MSRANFSNFMSRFAALCERNARLSDPLRAQTPTRADSFTIDDWRAEQLAREHADTVTRADHWKVTIDPGDGRLRTFYLRGDYSDIRERSHHIFPKTSAIVIEPSGLADAFERYDGRLNSLSLLGET